MSQLETRNLDCAYDGTTVVKNLNLLAHPGEVLILIGPNGAGKSTLLRASARLLHPQHGKVLLVERDLWSISSQDSARRIAFAPQVEKDSWPATVQQMVALGRAPHRGWLLPLTGHDREIINRMLELL
ncbi:MAG: ABC transporter ATP-binding protein, partial [Anaerolineae bacterium]|nr:ABC transporter ATP-binding protein [Anaerolineae bacterium]